jgi:hypothetical protein
MFSIKAERICRPTRVRLGVTGKPLFYPQHNLTHSGHTRFFSRALLEFLMSSHLIYFAGHGLDMRYNQFIEITIRVLSTHTKLASNGKLVCFVELENVCS